MIIRLRWLAIVVAGLTLLAGCGSSSTGGDAPASGAKAGEAADDGVEANGASVAGEGGEEAEEAADACPDAGHTAPADTAIAAELPDGIELQPGTRATEVRAGTVIGAATGELGDVLARYRSHAVAAGYEVTKVDNEGHEAEMSLRRADGDRAEIRLRRSSCPEAPTTVVILAGD